MPYSNTEKQRQYKIEHYQKNKDVYQARTKAHRSLLRKIIIELKHMMPCIDCKVVYPHWIMQYDHLPKHTKVMQISDLPNISSISKLLEEIDKCELVCANCHSNRTYMRRVT